LLDWQVNGRPLPSGTKFIPTFEFGLVRLEIRDALLRDAGMFKCTATNNLGVSSTAGTLHVLTDDAAAAGGPDAASLHPSGQAGLAAIQSVDQAAAAKLLRTAAPDDAVYGLPRFTTDLPAEVRLRAEANLVLECAVEPHKDPGLRLDWYHNGLPLSSGTRLLARAEFGQVSLAVTGLTERDAGIYTCKAVNALGEATTFARVYCEAAVGGVDATTKHPHGLAGLESIAGMEVRGRLPDGDDLDAGAPASPPRFTKAFADCELEHGVLGHFEALLEPRNEDIQLTWLHNGKPLKESSRFKRVHAFGMVLFEIVGVRAADEGTYTCVASNRAGKAEASFNLKLGTGKAKLGPKFTTQLKVN
jgi:titin